MAAEILQGLMGILDDNAMQQIGRQIGASPAQTQGAVQQALPLILGAMGRNAAEPNGAEALHRAVARDHANVDIGGLLGGLLGGGQAANPVASQGESILKHVFGARQDRAAVGLGRSSGLDQGSAAQLLKILAPIVMAQIGKTQQQKGLSSGGLGDLLGLIGGARPQAQSQPGGGGLLGAVLDRDGDGDVDFADLAPMAGQVLGGLFGGNR
ncbi:calcium-binding protein [Ahniella affigens]|uniref:Calcium-binding protein n=1 Tax=Ahniella affigens TaxID=2021234 RepID=A0A2P1PV58_9GAMM|nr:DUF937 domain-containing protein [Ahniella affigens]AVP98729.1 calcium-binding protein [Ahniella affigens]